MPFINNKHWRIGIPVNNKRIEAFILKQEQPYWTWYKYGSSYYIMTFSYRIYRKTDKTIVNVKGYNG